MDSRHSFECLVCPEDCDAFGHLSESAVLRMLETARWEVLSRGPGSRLFLDKGIWPAVRKSQMEHFLSAVPGDRLRVEVSLPVMGQSSFTLRQVMRRTGDDAVVAQGDFLFVCLDADGATTRVPVALGTFFDASALPGGETRRVARAGAELSVDIQGEGPAILFVHGFPLDRTMWRHLMSALPGWRRIAPDLRGLGQSHVPVEGYSMTAYAEDLVRVLDDLEIEQAVVCGLSMGGYVAFEMVRRHRRRIRGLILANTRAAADDPAGRRARDEMIELVRHEGTEVLADRLVPKLLGPSSVAAMPRVVERLRAMITGSPKTGVIGALAAMRDRWDSTPILETIDVPTLVIAGSEDQLMPVDQAQRMARHIPRATFRVISEAGHLTPLEQPIAVQRVLAEFLAGM